MNYLIAGLAKSGTTILFSRVQRALPAATRTFFEPDQEDHLLGITDAEQASSPSLTKVLIGRVTHTNRSILRFDRHVVIYRDPRDQFISMLLYLFYDFQLNGSREDFLRAYQALEQKVESPAEHSTIELYNLVASLVGRAPVIVFNNLHREQLSYIEAFSPHLLRYEDFVDGKLDEVQAYMGLDLNNDAQVPGDFQRVARSRGYGDWRGWLNDADLAYIQEHWGANLADMGYPEQNRAGELGIVSETSLGYVKQFDPAHHAPAPG